MTDLRIVVLAALFLLVAVIGVGFGKTLAADHCKDFGRFKVSGVVYECRVANDKDKQEQTR